LKIGVNEKKRLVIPLEKGDARVSRKGHHKKELQVPIPSRRGKAKSSPPEGEEKDVNYTILASFKKEAALAKTGQSFPRGGKKKKKKK